MSTALEFTKQDQDEARRIWADYQKSHELADRTGQFAGIDPRTGEVWFGQRITEIVAERRTRGMSSPLWFERVGSPTCFRKGSRR